MWHLGTWFSSGLGSVRLMVRLNDLKFFSNLNGSMLHDSMILATLHGWASQDAASAAHGCSQTLQGDALSCS